MRWRNFTGFVALLMRVPTEHLCIYAESYIAFIRDYNPQNDVTTREVLGAWMRLISDDGDDGPAAPAMVAKLDAVHVVYVAALFPSRDHPRRKSVWVATAAPRASRELATQRCPTAGPQQHSECCAMLAMSHSTAEASPMQSSCHSMSRS
jgi:hypothetical protein